MDICTDLNRLIFEFVEPNAGSILDAWLTHAQTTTSEAKFAREMRLHIPAVNILWFDLEFYTKNRALVLIVTTWVGEDRRNTNTEHHLMTKPFMTKPFCAEDVFDMVNRGLYMTRTNFVLTASTKVDLGFGHYKRFWQKPKEKLVLGIPTDLEKTRRAVLDTRFLKQE